MSLSDSTSEPIQQENNVTSSPLDKSDSLLVGDLGDSIHQDFPATVLTPLKNPITLYKIGYFKSLPKTDNINLLAPNTPMPIDKSNPLPGENLVDSIICAIIYQELTPLVDFENNKENNNRTNYSKLPKINNTLLAQCATTSSYNSNSDPLIHHQEISKMDNTYEIDSDDSLKDPDFSNEEISDESESESSEDKEEEECNAEEEKKNNADREQEDQLNQSNEIKRKSRKRTRDTENWKCNIRKKKRCSGEEYISKKNVKVEARKIQPPCQGRCRRKCFQKISPDTRNTIFKEFWSYGRDINQKRQFIASSVETSNVLQRRSRTGEKEGKRNTTKHFF